MRSLTYSCLFFLIGSCIVLCVGLYDAFEYEGLQSCALLLMLCLIIYSPLKSLLNKKFDYFEPMNIFLLTFSLGYLYPGLFLMSSDQHAYNFMVFDKQIFVRSLMLSDLTLLCFIFGYELYKDRSDDSQKELVKYNLKKVEVILWILFLIYLTAFISQRLLLGVQTTRGLGYEYGYGIFQPFTALGFFIPISYFVFFYVQGKKSLSLSVVSFILVLSSCVFNGSRGGVLCSLMAFVLYRHYLVKKINFISVLWFLGITIFIVIYIGVFRFKSFQSFDFNILREQSQRIFLTTFSGLESFMVVLSQTPTSIPYYLGRLILEVNFYPLFPRVFAPWKPSVYGYDRFWEDFIHSASGARTQMFVSMPGAFYLDFGIVGIILGPIILGFIFKYIYVHFKANQHRSTVTLLYGIFLVMVVQASPFAVASVYTLLLNFVIPIIVVKIIERSSA